MMAMIKLMLFAQVLVFVYGMDCNFGPESSNFIDKLEREFNKCPGLLGPQENSYCCLDENGKFYCCDLWKFLLTSSLIILPIAAILFVVSFIISCICCFCCPFCCIYKRRNGRVFI